LRHCGSTETELDRLLQAGASPPLVVLADRQSRGQGQQGRPWSSPRGGVWLSAALPWPEQAESAAALGLAVAVGLVRELESLGLAVRIKWPNDLLIGDRKLAGLLPRLRRRGSKIALARIGLGLNGWNRVPPGAIGLAEAPASSRRSSSVSVLLQCRKRWIRQGWGGARMVARAPGGGLTRDGLGGRGPGRSSRRRRAAATAPFKAASASCPCA
jgi:biotin-[acetyl-CoA-carboxylase] ligase BirA-like protein